MSRVKRLDDVVEPVGLAAGDDHVAPLRELVEVAHDLGGGEVVAVELELVDDDLDALRRDAHR